MCVCDIGDIGEGMCIYPEGSLERNESLHLLSSLIDNEKPDAHEAVSGFIRFDSEVEESD